MGVPVCVFVFVGYGQWLFFVLFVLVLACTGKLIGSLKLSFHGSLSSIKICTAHYFLLDLSSRNSLSYICLTKFLTGKVGTTRATIQNKGLTVSRGHVGEYEHYLRQLNLGYARENI